MSLYGSADRELTLLSVRVERSLSEDNMELTPFRTFVISIPFVDLRIDDFGWSLRNRIRLRRLGMSFWVDTDPGNDFRLRYHGDAIGLIGSGRYEAR